MQPGRCRHRPLWDDDRECYAPRGRRISHPCRAGGKSTSAMRGMRIATASLRTGLAMTDFTRGAVGIRIGSSGRPTPTHHSPIELRRGRRPRCPACTSLSCYPYTRQAAYLEKAALRVEGVCTRSRITSGRYSSHFTSSTAPASPAGGVGIRGHDRRKPPAQAKHIEGADFVLPLMAILHGVSLLSLCWVQYRRPTLDQVKTGKKSAPAGRKELGALLKN